MVVKGLVLGQSRIYPVIMQKYLYIVSSMAYGSPNCVNFLTLNQSQALVYMYSLPP